MRDQFYGDRKDVLKWTLALQAAGSEKRILYVVMYRPHKGTHGQDFRPIDQALQEVVRFFESERKKFGAGIPRRLAGVSALMPGRIDLVSEIYEHRDRRQYFEKILSRLCSRSPAQNFVVLLDPDNGIAGLNPKSEHVCPQQILSVWSAMWPGDVLIVYQHQFRDKEWRIKRLTVLASAINVPLGRIKEHRVEGVRDVCFFQVVKDMSDQSSLNLPCD
jgi:hypothetical protein